MPLPLIAVLLLVGTPAGVVATKTTTRIRRWWNEGETIEVHCPRCEDSGPHKFSSIDRGWTVSILTGAATGAIGGTVSGIVAKRVFKCKSCTASMYQDGKRLGWNADKAMHSFVHYPELRNALEDLEALLAQNQKVARKYAKEIKNLKRDLKSQDADKKELERRIRALIAQINKKGS